MRPPPRLPGRPGTLPPDHPLRPQLYRLAVEQLRDLYLAVRRRPLRSRLARPRMHERVQVLLSQHLPPAAHTRLVGSLRAGARLLQRLSRSAETRR